MYSAPLLDNFITQYNKCYYHYNYHYVIIIIIFLLKEKHYYYFCRFFFLYIMLDNFNKKWIRCLGVGLLCCLPQYK